MTTLLVWLFFSGVAVVLVVALGIFVMTNLLYICQPSEVLIFAGWRSDGTNTYRAIKGGRALRLPLVEVVHRIDLTNMVIDVKVTGAYSAGGIPLNVHGVANVKIAGHEPVLGNAVERLLGVERDRIMAMAREVLEGNLRGVLARLTPEEVNEDKIAFAEQLLDEAEPDLARIGLVLDTMKIQNVADERGYLDSLGRKQSAEILKLSRIGEANARAESTIQSAANRQRARIKAVEAQELILRAQVERRIVDAKTRAQALIAEAQGKVAIEVARAEGAVDAETARVQQVRRQLDADVLEPARAQMNASISKAQGRASRITEQGEATVSALRDMIAVWNAAGPAARDVVLMQRYQNLLKAMVSTLQDVHVDRVVYLPSGQGQDSTASRAVTLVEELKAAVGLDVPALVKQAVSKPSIASELD